MSKKPTKRDLAFSAHGVIRDRSKTRKTQARALRKATDLIVSGKVPAKTVSRMKISKATKAAVAIRRATPDEMFEILGETPKGR